MLMLRTLPHLRLRQIIYRPLRTAQFRAYRAWPQLAARWQNVDGHAPNAAEDAVAAIRMVFEMQLTHLHPRLDEAADLAAGRFTFLNRTLTIPQPDWNRRYENHLWNYRLHYFDYVPAAALRWVRSGEDTAWAHCRRLIASWIDEARIGGSDGWDAYPTSLQELVLGPPTAHTRRNDEWYAESRNCEQ